jgi:ABC-2 type transport system ATP-binding protein
MESTHRDTSTTQLTDEMRTAIRLEGVRKSYGGAAALRGLDMLVPTGSVYGLIGPNGAGKTTTLRLLATLERPDTGCIRLAGLDLRRDPRKARERVGYMPESFGVYDRLTVVEYLDFYAASYGIPRKQRRQLCAELMELMDLGGHRDSGAETLSRGMKQRLGLARCLVHDPQILLLDEPAAGLDPEGRLELHDVLRDLARLGKTIVISSHLLSELAETCTHVGIIREGQMAYEGPLHTMRGSASGPVRLSIQLLHPGQVGQALEYLTRHASCQNPAVVGPRTIHVEVDAGDESLSRLLTGMVETGIAVIGYSAPGTLEEVFLRMTSREGTPA